MGLFKNITGIMGNLFRIGGPSGPNIKNNSGVLEIKNTGDSAFTKLRALQIQSSNSVNDIPVLLDLMGHVPLIEFSFAGSSAPSAATNTAKFGFCHTTGGSYSVGDVVYDDGSTLTKINFVRAIFTTSAVSGTVSLQQNGVYTGSGSSWTLKGDGAATDTGFVKVIKIAYAYSDSSVDSTTSIPAGEKIFKVINSVTTAFNGSAPTLLAQVNGSTPLTIMATTESSLTSANQYEVETVADVESSNAGTVRLTIIPDSSTAGAGNVYVYHGLPGA